jgi:NADH-quinone oxidoreductase subunit M
MDYTYLLLTFLVFAPAAGAIVLMLPFWRAFGDDAIKWSTLAVTFAVFCASLVLLFPGTQYGFDASLGSMQQTFSFPWIPSFDIYYSLGIDGISMPLVILTTFVTMLSMGASWNITKHVQAYCVLFLLLETGVIGVFLSLDFFLFYVFWEVMLLPMYFLIGVWGGPRKEYAAIKFFLYTLLGGVLMLIAILMLYFNSDLGKLVAVSDLAGRSEVNWKSLRLPEDTLARAGRATYVQNEGASDEAARKHSRLVVYRLDSTLTSSDLVGPIELVLKDAPAAQATTARYEVTSEPPARRVVVELAPGHKTGTDVVVAVSTLAHQNASLRPVLDMTVAPGSNGASEILPTSVTILAPSSTPIHTFNLSALAALGQHTDCFSPTLQWWAFLLLFIGFIIKVPSVPVHTWLPDAHVEAPTPISMILAGILLKLGGYGIIRICYPICPVGGYQLAWFVCILGVVSIIYGAFAALAQTDFKRLVAYSSVSHMGYVLLGLGVWSAVAGTNYNPDYWIMGVKAAMFQMIAHGISSPGMFFCVGILYDRVHHRNLNEFGAIFGKMPVYTALAFGIFFAGLGLPGLCGFIGEFFSVLSSWRFSMVLAIIAASGVILTAGYILWCVQRVYLGAEYKGAHEEELHEMNGREGLILVPMFVLAIAFGVYPMWILGYMDATVDQQVKGLANWTKEYDEGRLAISPVKEPKKPVAAAAPAVPAPAVPAVPATAPPVSPPSSP